jgi:cytochrome c553
MKAHENALLGGLVVVSLTAMLCSDASMAQNPPGNATRQAAQTLAASVCAHCHGPEGRSTDPAVPQIAGQQRDYIEIQLKAFRAQTRRDPEAHDYMWGISSAWLDEKIMTEIAAYFSSRSPASGTSGDPAAIAIGEQLYRKGSPDRSIPACSGCHGENAEGLSVFPRLAGQHARYLTRQLQMLRIRLRDSPLMHGVSKDLTDAEITALATYLQSK